MQQTHCKGGTDGGEVEVDGNLLLAASRNMHKEKRAKANHWHRREARAMHSASRAGWKVPPQVIDDRKGRLSSRSSESMWPQVLPVYRCHAGFPA